MNDAEEDDFTPQEPGRDVKAVPELSEDDLKARRESVIEQKQYVTSRVSETCRFIGFGLLAVYYTLSISNEPFAVSLLASREWLVRAFGAAGALTVFFDYLQYVAGGRAANKALNRTNEGKKSYRYNKKWMSYRIREFSFVAKQVFAFVGSTILIFLMISALL
jgi:hypothetical protein